MTVNVVEGFGDQYRTESLLLRDAISWLVSNNTVGV